MTTTSGSRLHIAMVLRQFSSQGGLELYAYKLIEGLLARGHKVTVICQVNDTQLEAENLSIISFAAPTKGLGKAAKSKHYYEVASAKVAQSGPFDIIHSQHFPLAQAQVVTFHNHTAQRLSKLGYPAERLLNDLKLSFVEAYKLRQSYDEELAKNAAMRIFVARVMRDDFYSTYNLPHEAAFAIAPPGASLVGEANVALITQAEDKNQPFTFLFVGKGYRKKGLDTLIQAMKNLKEQGVKARLLIAGMNEKIHDKVYRQALGLREEIKYLGYCKNMAEIYAQARALILPSKLEPFGMAPIQAMQYGLPVIVSKVSGVSEVLAHEEDSLILQDHLNSRELASLMKRLIEDPLLYKKLSQEAKNKAQQLSWEKTVDATEEAYFQVLNKRSKDVSSTH
jgi:UDP-glucose:(heptosyl)LPS alpha-1,3-glucosyltransferase